jgi:hypothetical protein
MKIMSVKMAGHKVHTRIFHSKSKIASKLKQQNVVLRSHGNALGNPSQLRFGFRKTELGIVPHPGEQHVAGMI